MLNRNLHIDNLDHNLRNQKNSKKIFNYEKKARSDFKKFRNYF